MSSGTVMRFYGVRGARGVTAKVVDVITALVGTVLDVCGV